MDQTVLLRKVSRQLKWLNFWLGFFGILTLAGFAVTGILLYKVITYAHNAVNTIDNVQQKTQKSLNAQSQLCSNSAISSYLQGTGACQ